MKNIFLSILIPTFNSSKTIVTTLDSLPFSEEIEILICDDGSVDNTKEICEHWAQEHPNSIVKFFFEKHIGVSFVRKRLIEHACGKYVLFVDSDDTVDKKELLQCINELKINNFDILNSPYVLKNMSGEEKYIDVVPKTLEEYIRTLVYTSDTNALWTKIIKKKIITEANFFKNVTIGEDKIALISILKLINNYGATERHFAIHTLNNQSITCSKPNEFVLKPLIFYYDALQPILLELNFADDADNVYLFWHTIASYCARIFRYNIHSKQVRADLKTIKFSSWYKYYLKFNSKIRKRLPLLYRFLLRFYRL